MKNNVFFLANKQHFFLHHYLNGDFSHRPLQIRIEALTYRCRYPNTASRDRRVHMIMNTADYMMRHAAANVKSTMLHAAVIHTAPAASVKTITTPSMMMMQTIIYAAKTAQHIAHSARSAAAGRRQMIVAVAADCG